MNLKGGASRPDQTSLEWEKPPPHHSLAFCWLPQVRVSPQLTGKGWQAGNTGSLRLVERNHLLGGADGILGETAMESAVELGKPARPLVGHSGNLPGIVYRSVAELALGKPGGAPTIIEFPTCLPSTTSTRIEEMGREAHLSSRVPPVSSTGKA